MAKIAVLRTLMAMASRFRILFVRFWRGRQLKTIAEVIVLLRGGFQIEIRDGDLTMMPGRQVIEHVSHDRVILHFHLMAILEDEDGLGLIGDRSFSRLRRRG